MSESYQLQLPYLSSGQAQKHVTVNEALARVDALSPLRLVARGVNTPPTSPTDGAAWDVGAAATGDWAGQAGNIAIASNGGWQFVTPKQGWQCWDEALALRATYDGTAWVEDAQTVLPSGAATLGQIAEITHTLSAGATNTTSDVIPQNAIVLGVTGRVTAAITGSGVTGWKLGVSGSDNRYGAGLGLAANSYVHGVTGQPQAYYSATPLLLTAEGASFDAGGQIVLAVHYLQLKVPNAV